MTDLLAGPRGRRLCWALLDLPEIGLVDVPHADIEATVGTTVRLLSDADDATEARLLDALGRSVDFARYWQEPDACDDALGATPVRDLLRPVADAVLACPSAAWWSTPLAESQVHVGFVDGDRPTDPPLAGAAESLRAWRAEQAHITRFPLDVSESRGPDWWRATGRRGRRGRSACQAG